MFWQDLKTHQGGGCIFPRGAFSLGMGLWGGVYHSYNVFWQLADEKLN